MLRFNIWRFFQSNSRIACAFFRYFAWQTRSTQDSKILFLFSPWLCERRKFASRPGIANNRDWKKSTASVFWDFHTIFIHLFWLLVNFPCRLQDVLCGWILYSKNTYFLMLSINKNRCKSLIGSISQEKGNRIRLRVSQITFSWFRICESEGVWKFIGDLQF